MQASGAAMHLPKDDERDRLADLSPLDLDLDTLLGGISEAPVSLKKGSLECPECHRRGEKSYIRPYQLNFNEAMYLCPNPTCTYPMKEDQLIENFTFKREASLAVEDDKKELYHQSPDSLGDIFDSFSDSLFDCPMEFASGLDETSIANSGDSVTVNNLKTNSLEMSAPTTVNSSVTGAKKQCFSPTIDSQQLFSDSFESNMDTDNQSYVSQPGTSDIKANRDPPMSTDHKVIESSDKAGLAEPATVCPKVNFSSSMIQWKNQKNSCWLDSILQVAVASDNIRAAVRMTKLTSGDLWSRLINTYDQSQIALDDDTLTSSHDSTVSIDTLLANLNSAREYFLCNLKRTAIQLENGKFQSLIEMLPLSLKLDSKLENMFIVKVLWHFQCSSCLYQSARRSDKLIITMPNTHGHFHPLNAQFSSQCRSCKSQNESTMLWMEELPPCIVFHFKNGLSHSNLRVLDFAFCGQLYCVFAVVQYITHDSRHFVTWVRDIKKDRWLRCDDLAEPVCQWTQYQPKIPPHEIHMVFWERKHSEGTSMTENALEAIRNEEVIHLAESIPLEHFIAHEEEAIVIPEDVDSGLTTYCDPQSQVFDRSQTEACTKNACGVTADIESSTLMHTSGQTVAMHPTTVHKPGQYGRHDASSQTGPASASCLIAGFTHTNLQPVQQLVNSAMMLTPTDADRQHIQIIAPGKACNIYIVTGGGQMGQPIYLVPGASPKCNPPAFPTLPSFVNNPHSYNMVAQGVDGPLQNQTEKPKGPSRRIRRQFKLSGYSKRVSPENRYTPMQASKSYSSTKSADTICDVASVKSCNSKGDSETRSELSELSDMLPDFETSGHTRYRN